MSAAGISDYDTVLVKKLVEKHKPDVTEYDVKPLLQLIEDVLRHSSLSSEGVTTASHAPADQVKEDRSQLLDVTNMLEALSPMIDRISTEISCKTFDSVDAHSKTIELFDMLTMFKWDMKILLALAAFARSYSEFWLLGQIHDTTQFVKSMAILKKLYSIIEHADSLKPHFYTLNDLVKNILEVTKCIIEFRDLPTPEIAVASYWTIKSIVACAAQINSLTTLGYKIFMSTDPWELSSLTLKIKNIIDHILRMENLHEYYRIEQTEMISIGRASKMEDNSTLDLVDIFSKPHIDNMKVLKALIYAGNDILPLYHAVTKKRASLEPLRRKNVLLLFSGIDSSPEDDLLFLNYFSTELIKDTHELVWIPIVDPNSEWTDTKQKHFENLKDFVPYSVYHPSLIGKPVIRFIQSEWKYNNKPIIVVLDPQGRVVSPNAIYMIWIWGYHAYPFTSSREEDLWREQTWKLEFLDIDGKLFNWIKDGKYVFLYGGNDPEWVRKFVKEACKVATTAQIPLEMLYVGKSSKEEQVQKIIDTIIREKLNSHWMEQVMVWVFWFRLENMLFSKLQCIQTGDDDLVMKEIDKLLVYNQCGGWIILARGSHIVVTGDGTTGLQTLVEYDMWEENAKRDGFQQAFKTHYDKIHSLAVAGPVRIEFSQIIERTNIPEPLLRCCKCLGNMHVLTTFQCCHDEKLDEDFFATTSLPLLSK